ncbi:MAG: right-handed parallel beta-helix repeat-containing protein [Elusimicrobia bacterium]|nr:right-handed parallel beta-helix repeat-containing protein [Elusimicrobiota bacterium]
MTKTLLSALIALSLAAKAHAAKPFVVAMEGSGDFKTIDEAHEQAKKGDSILLRGIGPGKDGLWQLKAKDGIRYAGEGHAVAEAVVEKAKGVSFSRLRFKSVAIEESKGVLIEESLLSNAFSQQGPPSVQDLGLPGTRLISIKRSRDVTIRRCRISDSAGYGIWMIFSKGVVIESNLITNHWWGGVYLGGAARIARNTIAASHHPPSFTQDKLLAHYRLIEMPEPDAHAAIEGAQVGYGVMIPCIFVSGAISLEENIIDYNDDGVAAVAAQGWPCPKVIRKGLRNNVFFGNSGMSCA